MQITLSEDKKRSSETKKTSKAKPKAVKVNEKTCMTTLGVRRFDYGVAESENRDRTGYRFGVDGSRR